MHPVNAMDYSPSPQGELTLNCDASHMHNCIATKKCSESKKFYCQLNKVYTQVRLLVALQFGKLVTKNLC